MSVLIPLGYMAVLFVVSAIPDAGATHHLMRSVPDIVQNLLHIPAYGLLALLWVFTLRAYGYTEGKSLCGALVLASGYGAFTELSQAWIPGRYPSVVDFSFDVAGILVGIWILWWVNGQRAVTHVERLFHAERPDD